MKVNLEFDSRVFELLSKDLYKDDLSFIRELIQNSYDANSDLIEINTHENNNMITIKDNGCSMTYDFLVNDFKNIGKSFKKNGKIGLYGIGRLSLWLIAHKIEIYTKDSFVSWKHIDSYNVEKRDFTGVKEGVLFVIYVKKEKEDYVRYEYKIKQYIENNIILPIKINVNDIKVKNKKQDYPYEIKLPKHKVTVHIRESKDSSNYIEVFEKGLKVKDIWSNTLRCIIDFNKPIKTLSRESITITDYEVKEYLLKAYKKLANDYPSERDLFTKSFSYLASSFNDKDLAEIITIDNMTLKQYKKRKYYYFEPSNLVYRAKNLGYNVIVTEDYNLTNCFYLCNIPSLNLVKDKLKDKIIENKSVDKVGKEILIKSSDLLKTLDTITKDIIENRSFSNTGNIIKDDKLHEIEKTHNQLINNSLPDELIIDKGNNEVITVYGIVGFGYHDDTNIIAWNRRDKIVFNLNCELVKIALEYGNFSILEETICHEYIHKIGYHYHDSDFVGCYNLIRNKLLIAKAENSKSFSTKLNVSKAGKYKQFKINVPKQIIKNMELTKGTEINVTLE